ncbi:metal ABC transporter substrate-binding protein [Rhodospirillum sp. A1_3_36]|uniref:metal ABC transporter substrate-binding protein n=1 Tax=Rhodospirillum sp. A1_3_36 TaxID=3391666 RepID=UPI0039A47943
MKRSIPIVGLIGLALSATLYTSIASAKTLEAVASFSVLADVVKQVGGDAVHVKSLVPVNGDPHDFEPSPDDAKALKSADVTFVSGLGLEGWFERLAKASGYADDPVVVSDGIKTLTLEEDGQTITDPHVWNSAANVLIWVTNIEKALSKADPEDAATFKANAEQYSKKLRDLDRYATSSISSIPPEKRKVLTSHDAFGYFGHEYGVTFLSPLGVSTETEASAADVAQLIDQIKEEQVKVYFIENSNDPRLVKQIANATGAEPGGELYVESLSDAAGPAPTYAKMFRYNVDQIVGAIMK